MAQAPTLNEESQRIVEVKLKEGTILTDAMILYPNGTSWLVPLGSLSEGLGIAITPFIELGKAEGFILQERRTFSLNTQTCQVEIERKISQYNCDLVVPYEQDFYVDISLLQKWLPVDLQFDTFSSSLVIKSREPLPVEEAMERERRAKTLKAMNANYDPGFPRVKTPSANAEGPFVDQQLNYNHQNNTNLYQHDTLISGEVLGFGSSLYARGNEEKFDQIRASMAKKDPDGNLLGPLHARSVELFDVGLPTLPVIGAGGFGRGAIVSSYPLYSPSDYSNQTLQGPLPTGWEVELYQNETLIDRKVSDQTGRYEFKSVPLTYGMNRFRLIFYGPQGQRREEFKTYNIDPNMQKPGSRDFRIAYAELERSGGTRAMAQFDQNLIAPVTLRVSTAALRPEKDTQTRAYHTASLLGTYGPLLATATGIITDFGGRAQEYGIQAPLERLTFGLKRTFLWDFHSDLYALDPNKQIHQSTSASVTAVILPNPALRMTADAIEDRYTNGEVQKHLLHRTSLLTGPIYWNNEIDFQEGVSNTFLGSLSSSLLLSKAQLRLEGKYDREQVTNLGADTQYNFTEKYLGRFAISHLLEQNLTTLTLMVNRTFERFAVSASIDYNSENDYAVGSTLSYSFARDPNTNSWRMNGSAQASFGAASILVYDDKNRNGLFDNGDQPLPNIPLRSPQRELEGKTNDNGRAFITQLSPFQPFDIAISPSGLENPFQKPVHQGLRIVPRPGKTTSLEFAVQTFTEVSGIIDYPNHFKKGIPLELVDSNGRIVAETKAESDGFYNFDYIAPGSYVLRVNPEYRLTRKIKSSPDSLPLIAPDDGTSEAGFDFVLK